jgi:hypothetical protein
MSGGVDFSHGAFGRIPLFSKETDSALGIVLAVLLWRVCICGGSKEVTVSDTPALHDQSDAAAGAGG